MIWNVREAEDIDDFYIYQEWSSLLASFNVSFGEWEKIPRL